MEFGKDEFSHLLGNAIDKNFWNDFVIPIIRRRDENKCQCCGSTKYLHTHHLSYSIDISINDLVTLCKSCHFLCHRKGKNFRQSETNKAKVLILEKKGYLVK